MAFPLMAIGAGIGQFVDSLNQHRQQQAQMQLNMLRMRMEQARFNQEMAVKQQELGLGQIAGALGNPFGGSGTGAPGMPPMGGAGGFGTASPAPGAPSSFAPPVNVTTGQGGGMKPGGALSLGQLAQLDPVERLIAQDESNFRNGPNYRYDPTHTAGGYFQQTNTNWRKYGNPAYPNAMAAPFEEQLAAERRQRAAEGLGPWANFNPKLSRDLATLGPQAPAAPAGFPQFPPGQSSPDAGGTLPLNRGFLVPPGTPFSTSGPNAGRPYSPTLTQQTPQERANVDASMSAIKAAQQAGKDPFAIAGGGGAQQQAQQYDSRARGPQLAQANTGTMSDAGPQLPQLPPPPNPQLIYQQTVADAVRMGVNPNTPIGQALISNGTMERYKGQMTMWEAQKAAYDERYKEARDRRADEAAKRAEDAAGLGHRTDLALPDGTVVVGIEGRPDTFTTRSGKKLTPEQIAQLDRAQKPAQSGFTLSDEDAKMLAQQRMAGDVTALQGLGWGTVGAANRGKVIAAMRQLGATGPELAAARAEFSATTAAAQTAGRRGAQIGMAINELTSFIPEAKRISELVDRTQFPSLNSVLLAAQAGTGDDNVKKLALVTNEVINAYAQVATRGGLPTDAARAQGQEILNSAFTKGQYGAVLDEMMNLAKAASSAPPATIKETTDRLRNLYATPGAAPAPGGGPNAAPQGGTGGPAVGAVESGYRFKGGDPADQKNWEKAQ